MVLWSYTQIKSLKEFHVCQNGDTHKTWTSYTICVTSIRPYTALADNLWTPYANISDNLWTPYANISDNLWSPYTDFG